MLFPALRCHKQQHVYPGDNPPEIFPSEAHTSVGASKKISLNKEISPESKKADSAWQRKLSAIAGRRTSSQESEGWFKGQCPKLVLPAEGGTLWSGWQLSDGRVLWANTQERENRWGPAVLRKESGGKRSVPRQFAEVAGSLPAQHVVSNYPQSSPGKATCQATAGFAKHGVLPEGADSH